LTGDRDMVGTPLYMAPEQVERPQTVDHRADIYSPRQQNLWVDSGSGSRPRL